MITIAVEIGGTFTDLVMARDGVVERTVKVPSTPKSPDRGALAAIDALGIPLGEVELLVHGSTVATNAVLERKGLETCLLVTEGFRDLLEIQREERRDLYDLHYVKPRPLVSRDKVLPVRERLSHEGEVVVPLDVEGALAMVERMAARGVESIAICLLHSYAHPMHEERLRDALRQRFPDRTIAVSSAILPEFREYERASTTVVNAYVAPIMQRYVGRMGSGLKERSFDGSFRVVQSNGGVLPAEHIADHAVRVVLSGPAAGVIGAARLASAAGFDDVITFDMGGTSTDVCLVTDAKPSITTDSRIDGLPVRVPMIDIVTTGAGGGSIARVEAGRLLRVGPESAGADPGPACYDRGGGAPTTTDANLLLGRIRPEGFFGGRMILRRDLAEAAMRRIAQPLGMSVLEAAESVVAVSNATMAQAIRLVSIKRGYDPRDYALLAFGGAGPLHACALADELDIGSVLVPVGPGVLSAFGLLVADFKRDYVQTALSSGSALSAPELAAHFERLERRALAELTSYRIPWDRRVQELSVDMRYAGQAFELNVPIDLDRLAADGSGPLVDAFHAAHERRYGHAARNEEVELVNCRLVVSVPQASVRVDPPCSGDSRPRSVEGEVFSRGRWHAAPFLDRTSLPPGFEFEGPAVVEEASATNYVPDTWRGRVDGAGNVVLTRKAP